MLNEDINNAGHIEDSARTARGMQRMPQTPLSMQCLISCTDWG